MVEHLVCNQAVVGSNPVASTRGTSMAIHLELKAPEPCRFGRTKATQEERNSHKRPATQSAFFDI